MFTRTFIRDSSRTNLGRTFRATALALATLVAVTAAHGEDSLRTAYTPANGTNYYGTFPGFQTTPATPSMPAAVPAAPATDRDEIQKRLMQRYGNPVVARFIATTPAQRGAALYQETSRLIDTRHLRPATYTDRVQQAIRNLVVAVETPMFLQANQIHPSDDRVRAFQASLEQMLGGRTVSSMTDAISVMNGTIDLAGRQLGLRPMAVVAEFVYGATESLDKYSAFEPEVGARQPSAALGLEDHIVGIGVEIKPHDSGVLVVKALPGGPAARAGLQADDVVVAINGRDLQGQTLEYAVDQITGPLGSSLTLTVVRNGRQLPAMTLVRSRVTINSVSEYKLLAGEVGYIKLDKFAESSEREMDQSLWSLHEQGMKSLVIDLRGNPGGLLTTAIALSDKFLPAGPIVSTRGRTTGDQMLQTAKYPNTWKVPLVVLVDSNSASASEIFAAAIQENRRGLVVGHTTFGKGTVQTHFPLTSVSGSLRLTTATFYAPSGRPMAELGVEPDIRLDDVLAGLGGTLTEELVMSVSINMARSDYLQRMAETSILSSTPGMAQSFPQR